MRRRFPKTWLVLLALVVASHVGAAISTRAQTTEAPPLDQKAKRIFGVLPSEAPNPNNPVTNAKVTLGRMLYFAPRFSKNQDISCNSCHGLDTFGVDGKSTSTGHKEQRGGRNAPTVYNAALHVAQLWDGREPDVERQALGPPLNPIEMAMPDGAAVEKMLRSIPGYAPLFRAAFPGEAEPVTFAKMGKAIGAFERTLLTPALIDAFMAGDLGALDAQQQRGFQTFMGSGCVTCHVGPLIGGSQFQKIGLVNPYETDDPGVFAISGKEADRKVFKVPSLRNLAKTAPYFHDGTVATLQEAVRLMGHHQLGIELRDTQVADILAFLNALTGEPDPAQFAKPELPPSGPDTPAPDPS
jgi:cytochrome c peroxidase